MEKALQNLQLLTLQHNNIRKIFYDNEKLIRNYNECIQLCNQDTIYKLCLFEETSTSYAVVTIKIYEHECSEIVDYTNIIQFTTYIENDTLKELPYNRIGIIPNYKYVVGDNNLFKNINYNKRENDYYLIELKIPFI